MPEVLLVQPPIRDFYLTAKRTVPYGLASIAAALCENDISTEIFDALAVSKSRVLTWPPEFHDLLPYYGTADIAPFALFHQFRHYGYSYEHISSVIRQREPMVVGISSLFTPYQQEALDTARVVKQVDPKILTVLGGHHPTAFPETVMECPDVDFVIRGDGETALPALVSALKTGGALEAVPGLVFRGNSGHLHIGEPVFMSNLDNQSAAVHHWIDCRYYRRKHLPGTVIVASRGCPMRCSYCCVGNGPAPYRRKSVSNVIREIDAAVTDHPGAFIDFEDENLAYDRHWFVELLEGIIDRFKGKTLELRAMNGLMPSSLDARLVAMMKTAGFKSLNLSLGSTHGKRLKAFNRPDVRQGLDVALGLAKYHGMEAVTYIIAAAPGQPADESLDDILALAAKSSLIGLSVFYPAPKSPDYETCRRRGTLPSRFSLFRSSAFPIEDGADRLQTATLLRLVRMVNFLKALVKAGSGVPVPRRFETDSIDLPKNRSDLGRLLVSGFLSDGQIRGITPDGRMFIHEVSEKLTRRFREAILTTPIRI